jgi:hypothetical protein
MVNIQHAASVFKIHRHGLLPRRGDLGSDAGDGGLERDVRVLEGVGAEDGVWRAYGGEDGGAGGSGGSEVARDVCCGNGGTYYEDALGEG